MHVDAALNFLFCLNSRNFAKVPGLIRSELIELMGSGWNETSSNFGDCSQHLTGDSCLRSLAKIAGGLCDNLLLSVVRAWDFKRPLLVTLFFLNRPVYLWL